ncbi:hypothetical protein WJX72_004909 [[Myrmecia] bisecta]|uniref:Uncharacterized protein n=1 Tax=[Myrmecia] bisecta TaxID=41462 RepID=A0AAW1Q638_9CHLO
MSVDALHEHTANLVCLEAVWPAYPIVHDVVAAASSGSALWTAGRAGSIIRWAQPDRSGAWEPAVLCCGHSAPVHTLLSCTAGQPALLSVDEQGGICLWEEATGICNHRAVLPIRPGAKAVAFTSGEHVCLHCQSGADASAAAGDHALAVVQAGSLAVVAMVMPAAMQSLARFFEQGPFLVGGDALAPAFCVQGFSSGAVVLTPLAICSMAHQLTCLRHTAAAPPALCVHTAAVTHMLPPPETAPLPWSCCIASIGADGTVCIVSLITLRCERVLPGHPPGSPYHIFWDPTLGYMACMCSDPEGPAGPGLSDQGHEPLLILWDIHAGRQDPGQGERPHSSPSTPAGSMAPPPTPTAAVANYLPAAVHLVEVDIRGLLVMPPVLAAQPAAPASETAPPMHPFASGSPKRAVQKAGITKSSGRGVRLRELLPKLPVPDLPLWGSLWQETNDSLREAARALLAAATDPAAYGLRGAVPYEAMAIIIRTGLSPTQLQPQQMLDLTLQVADDAAWPPHQLIVAGAACVYHARDMPEELLARVVPQLVGLVCGPPGPHSSAAASVMAEGLTGPSAVRWKQHLSDLTALIQKVLAVCERLGAVAAGPLTSSAPPTKQAPRRLPSTRTIGRTVSLTLASAGYSAAKVAAAGSVTSMSMRDLSQAAPQAEASASASKPQLKSAELMKCRDSVASLLPALAAIDLRMFLHLMGHRMTGGCVGESPSHLMCLMALVRLMHSRGGLAQVAAHLPLLITVVLKGLDPVFPALRRTCLQGVMAVVKEVCMRFPMVTFTVAVNPMLLAVGCAPSQDQAMPAVGGSHLDVGEPIAVYDMDTGAKKRALHFRADGPTRVRQASEAISAAAFNASGDSLAAFTAADSCVRIWPLVAAWTQRLQRGPAVLLPTARLSVPPLAQGPRPLKGGSAVDLGYHVVWETDSRVAVVYHGQRVTVNVPV